MPTVLITGCDTGIGRSFAEQYAGAGWSVVATFKNLAHAPRAAKNFRARQLDVTVPEHFVQLKQELAGEPLHLLVSNAGIGLDVRKLGDLDYTYVQKMHEVNMMGPLRLVETFVDNLVASRRAKIACITSRMGSIGLNLSGGHYGYRASKAGLNAAMRSLAIDLFPRGITVVLLHPGWVATAGGSNDAPLTAAASVASMRSVIERLGNHETGQYLSYDGSPLPW